MISKSAPYPEDVYKRQVKDMYPTTEAWENELKVITEIVDKIASYEGSVAATAENLLAVLEHLASAGEKIEKAFNYAERLFDEDQTNTTHQAMSAKVYSLYAAMGSKTAFVDLSLIHISFFSCKEYLEYCPVNTDKGTGAQYLVKLLNIPHTSTVAIGDEQNDIPMIQSAHIGIRCV